MDYFFFLCPPLRDMVANMRGIHALKRNKYDYFNNLIEMIEEIRDLPEQRLVVLQYSISTYEFLVKLENLEVYLILNFF